MSRTQLALSFEQTGPASSAATGAHHAAEPVRPVTLFVHVSEDALTGTEPGGPV